eukprot:6070976-Pleurochrysis_carterae.AAC.1
MVSVPRHRRRLCRLNSGRPTYVVDEIEKICREPEAQKAHDAAAGSSDEADGNADAATDALDNAAGTVVTPPSDANESADAVSATHDITAETPAAVPMVTDENVETNT